MEIKTMLSVPGTISRAGRAREATRISGLSNVATRTADPFVDPRGHPALSARPRPDSSRASGVSILSPRRNAERATEKAEIGVVTSRNVAKIEHLGLLLGFRLFGDRQVEVRYAVGLSAPGEVGVVGNDERYLGV
jgi:hypothetical protein